MVTVEREGRRSYLIGDTFAIKDAIRSAGGHWDSQRRAWWLGKHDVAQQIAVEVADVPKPTEEEIAARRLAYDREHILGRAVRDGRSYYLVGEGVGERGPWVRLLFHDGSRTIFADGAQVEIVKRYEQPKSLDDLRAYVERIRRQRSSRRRRGGRRGYDSDYGCAACEYNEDAGDMQGCPRHRGNPL
jgi:hypothetical protein